MSATAASLSFNARTTTVVVTVPNDDIAKLMYYLFCVTKRIGLQVLPDALTDYQNYRALTSSQRLLVIRYASELTPSLFINKLIFRDDERRICKDLPNEFVTLTTACNFVSAQRGILLAGKMQEVTQVMFFRSSWLDRNYVEPLARMSRLLRR